MTPQPHKTSITFEPDAYVILQALMAQRQPWNQSDAVNAALRFYYHHADNPELDSLTSNLATIRKQLDELLTRAPTIDPHSLATEIIAQLDAKAPPETPPVPVTPEPIPPTLELPKPRWSERFAKRFGKPPPEHW